MRTYTTRLILFIFFACALCGAQLAAQAQSNEQIRFQGRLTDPAGSAITTVTQVRFRLYTSPTAVTHVWEETHANVVPSATGIITVQLGSINAFSGVNFGQPLYIGVTVESDPEMAPRYLLSSSAVSHFARNAASLNGLPASAYALLSGATFTGTVTAPTFVGNLTGTASSFSGSLSGDVTGTQSATVVTSVGGVTAANVASGANLANAATTANAANTIVRRDGSGNFAAGTITATSFVGNLTGTATSATTATNFTGTLAGDVTGTQGTTVVSSVGGVTAANVASGANLANAATANNTANQLVRRDGSGNFAAGTITGSFVGNLTGTASNATQAANATNANALLGATWAAPQAIGSGTPAAGSFTSLSSGSLNVAGQSSLIAPLVNAPPAGFRAHDFEASVQNSGTTNARALQSTITSTGTPGPGTISGAILTATNVGETTQGAQGVGTYTGAGTNPTTHIVSGLNGEARVTNPSAAVLAMGAYGRSQDAQAGINVGLFGVGRGSTGRNLGSFLVANASDIDQATFSLGLPGNLSASALVLNPASGPNDFGLHVNAANNLIAGNLTVTGSLNANITANDTALFDGQGPAFYLSRDNHTGTLPGGALAGTYSGALTFSNAANAFNGSFIGDGSGLTGLSAAQVSGLGSMAFEDAVDYYSITGTDGAISGAIAGLNLGTMAQQDAADYYTSIQTDSLVSGAITALNLGSMSQEDAADYTPTAGLGTLAFQPANNVAVTGGSISGLNSLGVSGLSSFIAPNALAPTAPSYSAHTFEASVESNAAVPSRSLFSKMTGVDAGTREVTGAWLEAVSDGSTTQGVFGQAWYTGDGTFGHVAIGLDGRARTGSGVGPGNSVVAIGTAGRADDTQGGSNIGVHAWARNGDKSSGLFAIANADETAQFTHGASLPSGFSAAVLGLNTEGGANDYGLHITALNNVIDGDLTVTGTINAPISGTISADNITDGTLALATGNIILGSGQFTGDGSGLTGVNAALLDGHLVGAFLRGVNNLSDLADAAAARTNLGLGSMALENTSSYYTISGTNSAISSALLDYTPTSALGDMAFENTSSYYTITGTDAAISSAISGIGLGSMAFEDAADFYTSIQTDSAIDAAILAQGLGTIATQDADSVNISGGTITGVNGSFTSLSSTGGMNITGRSTISATSIANNNALTMNLLLDSAPGGSDAAGESGQGINVLATTGANAQRAIAMRGRVEDTTATTSARQIHSVVGVARTIGGENTSAAGGYFNAHALSGMTDGILSLSGIAADASVASGADFKADSLLIGGRFGADSSNAGEGAAFGVLGTAIGTNARSGSNTGVFGWAAGANPSNVGVFGAANASQAQIENIAATNPNAGVYAFNPNLAGNNFALVTDGRSNFITPQATEPTGTYRAHSFEASVDQAGATYPSALFARMTGTGSAPLGPGGAEVSGAHIEAISDGGITQAVYGRAEYTGSTGTAADTWVMGVLGYPRVTNPAASVFAMGLAGNAESPQTGANVGVYARGAGATGAGARNIGLFSLANANVAQQTAFSAGLPADISAAMVGYNSATGSSAYGLYVEGQNNRIVGDLTVTGTITGAVSGTISANNITDGNLTLATGNISLTGGTFTGDGSGLTGVNAAELGGLASAAFLQAANNLSDLANVTTARTNLGLGTLALQNAGAVAITGGTINDTVIGSTGAAAGTFTSLVADTITGVTNLTVTSGGSVNLPNGSVANAALSASANDTIAAFAAATANNVADTIVRRDSNGDFAARDVTAAAVDTGALRGAGANRFAQRYTVQPGDFSGSVVTIHNASITPTSVVIATINELNGTRAGIFVTGAVTGSGTVAISMSAAAESGDVISYIVVNP